jgi:WD40 repeat protein/regulator of sirC expression with transglutaminase-like and TPR domain/predicted Ser/Thr protein kinase
MQINPRVIELVIDWEEKRERGLAVTPEELCAKTPDLLPEVKRRIEQMRRFKDMAETSSATDTNGPDIAKAEPDIEGDRIAGTDRPGQQRMGRSTALPSVFGRYRVLTPLGEGGMGAVYLVLDTVLDRRVALKVPHFTAADGPDILERFYREARAAATIQHPNICPVHDVGALDGTHFLTMAYIEGKTLLNVLRESKNLPQRDAAVLVHKLALALQEAHDHGVIHRDLKPANIIINRRGEPVIMDFGLAKRALPGEARLTRDGAMIGTPAYMSPEQINGNIQSMGPACDIYSLGVMLYELLTGQLPFRGSVVEVVGQILSQTPKPLSALRPGIDPRLEAICMRAMAKEVKDRFAAMSDLATALADFLKASAPVAPPEQSTASRAAPCAASASARPRRVSGLALAVCLGLFLFLGIGVAGVVVYRIQTDRGVLVIETADPDIEVTIKQGGNLVRIYDPKTDKQIELHSGKYEVELSKGKQGLKLYPKEFEMSRGGKPIVKVFLEPPAPKIEPPPTTDPKKAAEHLAAAGKLFHKGQYEQAVAACTEALRLDPNLMHARALRGAAHDNLRQHDECIRDTTEAIRQNPELYRESYCHRSGSYLRKGAFAECIADANEVLKVDSAGTWEKSTAYEARAWALASMGHYDLALADCAEVERLNPKNGFPYWCRSHIHAKQGNTAEAKADGEKALRMSPSLPAWFASLADPPNLSPADEKVGLIRTFKGTKPINCAALSPNGRLAISGDDDNTCRLWDVATGKELFRFPGHTENVICVAFSPDGRLALSAGSRVVTPDGLWARGSDFDIRIWDVATRQLRCKLTGHTNTIFHAVFSADSKQVLSGDASGVVRLWNVESEKPIHRLFNPSCVWSVAMSQDGTQALVAGGAQANKEEQFLCLWDLKTGNKLPPDFTGHTWLTPSVAFSPDGTQALSGSWDRTMCLWDIAGRKKVKAFPALRSAVHRVAFANKGRWVIAGLTDGPDFAIHIYETATGNPVALLEKHTGGINSLAVAADGLHLLSASADGTMRWWRLPEAETADRQKAAGHLAVADKFNANRQYDQAIAACTEALRLDPKWAKAHVVRACAYGNLGKWQQCIDDCTNAIEQDAKYTAAYTNRGWANGNLGKWDKCLHDATEAIRLDPKDADAHRVLGWASGNLGKWDKCIDEATQAIRLNPKDAAAYEIRSWGYLNKNDYPQCIAEANKAVELDVNIFTAYANRGWALANLGHYELALADYAEVLRLSPQNGYHYMGRSMIHAKAGNNAAAKADKETALKLDPTLAKLPGTLADPPNLSPPGEKVGLVRTFDVNNKEQINCVALAPDARLALSGGIDHTFRLWDVATGKEIYRFPGHQENVWCVAFSPDGRLALSAGGGTWSAKDGWLPGSDFEIRVWDVAKREQKIRLKGHANRVNGAVFAPNSKQILSADINGVVRLWDVANGTLIDHRDIVGSSPGRVALSRDGSKALIAGGGDKLVHLWDLKSKELHSFTGHTGFVGSVAFSPDGSKALSGSWDRMMRTWDIAGKKPLKTSPQHLTTVNFVAFANQGRWVIACIGGVADDTGNKFIAAGGHDFDIHIYDTTTSEPIDRLKGHTADVLGVAVAQDGRHILSGGWGGQIRWWRLPNPK